MVQRDMLSPYSVFKDNIQVWHSVKLGLVFGRWRCRQHVSVKHCYSRTWHSVVSSGKHSFGCFKECHPRYVGKLDRWEGSQNTTRMIYKRCIFLGVKSKQHVLAVYGHHQVLCQLRFYYINCVNCVMIWRSPHRIIVEIYLLCMGGYYARLICSAPCIVLYCCIVFIYFPKFHIQECIQWM